MSVSKAQLSRHIKAKAEALGFMDCGIAAARRLDEHEAPLKSWLKEQRHGRMAYMNRNVEKRLDPRELMPGARSIIVVLQNYYTPEKQPEDVPKISKHAYGVDYHRIVKQKLHQLAAFIQSETGSLQYRAFTDSAPVLEKAWFAEAGLGWIGKNGNALTTYHGSYFFIGELIVDTELDYDTPVYTNYCGSCTRCMEACPTGAIFAPHKVDATKCISYWTTEYPGAFDHEQPETLANYAFGCDICQEVCPWNKKASQHQEPAFNPHPQLLTMDNQAWKNLTEAQYRKIFKKSTVKRTKYQGIVRNLHFIYTKDRSHE